MKTFLKYLIVILLSAALGGLIVAFLLPYADEGDEGGTTVEQPGENPVNPDISDDEDNTGVENPPAPVTTTTALNIAAFAEQAGGYGSNSDANTTEEITVDIFTFAAGMRAEERTDGFCINNQQYGITFELTGDTDSITIYFKGASSDGCTMYLYCGGSVVHTWQTLDNGVFNTDNTDGEVISDLPAGNYTLISTVSARIYSLGVSQTK